ncbi:hypothetical protein C8A03DRAFT_35721 [Achaetomium macrosporum]|uniref:Uncharacterized protein n=1 Tax=Achaetomium macrosporum TaxID=79813 RepID=A0AAN7C7E0_9PEZI|nr:hypothetical protein C8A03DRAFT_35721 [Achaetomium macrosporum]
MDGEPETSPEPVTLTELLLRTGILALKVLIPMLWLQSKLSPLQFLVGGAALVLAAFIFDSSPSQDPGRARRAVRFSDPLSVEDSED